MGDVALLAPVLRSFHAEYPNDRITLVTRPKFSVFFQEEETLKVFPADVDKTYSGFLGLLRLFFDLRRTRPTHILDLHDHLRTRLISFLFRLSGVPVVRLVKGRPEKKALTRTQNKIRIQLPHTVHRYHQVFSKAGFTFSILPAPHLPITVEATEKMDDWLLINDLKKKELWLGVAPFAAHKSKVWPLENYSKLLSSILEKTPAKFFLFGGGKSEIEFFEKLYREHPSNCVLIAGQLKLPTELALMKKLDKMICADSSNMHLAALLGVPTVSIWGGTHSDAGFGPFGNVSDEKVQIDVKELPCRPCSVYGTETCHRGDFACLTRIQVNQVLDGLGIR
jgi:ADP-heptose:LPS heptosyltransferase